MVPAGNDNNSRGNPEIARQNDKAQHYDFQGKNEAKTSYTIIIFTIIVCDWIANVISFVFY